MEEKRSIERIDSFIPSFVNDESCYITDITCKGASLFFNVRKEIKKGELIEIKVDLSNLTYMFKKEVNIKAKVTWVNFKDDKTILGVSFVEENKKDIRFILDNWESIIP